MLSKFSKSMYTELFILHFTFKLNINDSNYIIKVDHLNNTNYVFDKN